jgi:single-strand DNA-binding protein
MNKAILVGRLTRDPELRTTGSGVSVCSFTIAINRRFRNAEGNYDADFINCVAWRQQAELISKYFAKGRMIGVVGSIQTRNYDKDGQKVYITEVVVDEVDFVESKSQGETGSAPVANASSNTATFGAEEGFIPTPADDDLPF